MKKLPKVNTSKLLKAALPYILVGLMATKLGQAYRMASGGDVLDRIFGAFLKIGEAFANPLPSLHPFDLLVGDACGALLWFIVYQKSKNARKYRRGAEYGTARWGNAKDIEPFIDPDFSQNILLSETERLTLGKIADPEKRNVNLNVLVIGGSGSGKTRYHIKPNLLQMNASYVCSDPKGTVIEEVGRALVRGGYKIKVLNTIDFSCSMHYNPFVYLHSETDILTLVTVIMTNTQGEAKGGDGFWEKAEALLYQALIAYIYYEAPAEERNMNTLLDMPKPCRRLQRGRPLKRLRLPPKREPPARPGTSRKICFYQLWNTPAPKNLPRSRAQSARAWAHLPPVPVCWKSWCVAVSWNARAGSFFPQKRGST